jgi:hypothetical protein
MLSHYSAPFAMRGGFGCYLSKEPKQTGSSPPRLLVGVVFVAILNPIVCEADFTGNVRLEGETAIGGLATGEQHTRGSNESPGAGIGISLYKALLVFSRREKPADRGGGG